MKLFNVSIIALAALASGCKNNTEQEEQDVQTEEQSVVTQDQENDWQELSSGNDLSGWKAYKTDSISDQWKKEGEAIVFTPSEDSPEGSENLITEDEYTNFQLDFEWKISEGGNSGIMWGVQEMEEYNEPYYTGPEIQLLDNERHPDAKNGPVRQAGALYDMVPPGEDVTNPAGEWNTQSIVIDHKNNKGSVTLNGTKVTEFPVHGDEWEQMVSESKFSDWEDFGKSRTGHIALQDHGNKVAFKNIRIKELE
ncbi:3-keto-disaccharide hydrolase [Autumnicola edwardsiae]|uniref:DUF1080 domain-containing protein n=1 Tax=Autumnicola edwardsiae TaxID=3075594 RepID=A0ABU3CYF0_9FLAO|nr:DUF1080 domain-containing protein [Zunongwangia sp. F297]MDT0651281.1 DUF1080 domain-containing protein [Zunongwangia sp. F297]